MPAKASTRQVRQGQCERARRPIQFEPDVNSYFDPFDRLMDEFVDHARQPFGEAVKRLEVALAGRYELFPAELEAEGARLCEEIGAAEKAIIDCCKHYCGTWPDQFNRFTSPSLRRRVAAATAQLKALIPVLNSHTSRLNAFLGSVTPAATELAEAIPWAAWLSRIPMRIATIMLVLAGLLFAAPAVSMYPCQESGLLKFVQRMTDSRLRQVCSCGDRPHEGERTPQKLEYGAAGGRGGT